MKYQLIYSEELLEEFLSLLPEENEDEVYYLSLFARKKYSQELIWSNDKTQLKRLTSKKRDIIKKIKQLEVDYGLYDLNRLEDLIIKSVAGDYFNLEEENL